MPPYSPLNPPGPPSPTGKTLPEVRRAVAINSTNTPGDENYAHFISTSGVFFLTEDLYVPLGKSGIRIAVTGTVILDLNGFSILGEGTGLGVSGSSLIRQVVLRNGTIRNFHQGVYFFGTSSLRSTVHLIDHVTVESCADCGLLIDHQATTVRNCRLVNNGVDGARIGNGLIESSLSRGNAGHGFMLYGGMGRLRHCVATANGQDGIHSSPSHSLGGSVSSCVATANGGYGINFCKGRLESCIVSRNSAGGFHAVGARLTRNLARRNGPDGNGTAAGIHVTNSCVVEDNYCVGNERGIVATGPRNLIQRNACSGNGTNWVIAAGNTANVIVAAKSPSSDDAPNGVPLGSSDPLVNYTF